MTVIIIIDITSCSWCWGLYPILAFRPHSHTQTQRDEPGSIISRIQEDIAYHLLVPESPRNNQAGPSYTGSCKITKENALQGGIDCAKIDFGNFHYFDQLTVSTSISSMASSS